jgi:hypothetical protein
VLGLRTGTMGSAAAKDWPGLSDLGLLMDGCKLPARAALRRDPGDNTSNIASFSSPVQANGWFFTTAADLPAELEPAAYTLEGSNDLVNWRLAGAEAVAFPHSLLGSRVMPVRGSPPATRGGAQHDLRPDLAWLVGWVLILGFPCAWWWMLLVLNFFEANFLWYSRVAAAGLAGQAVSAGIIAAIRSSALGLQAGVPFIFRGVALGSFSFGIMLAESTCAYWVGLAGMVLACADFAGIWIYEGGQDLPVPNVLLAELLGTGVLGVAFGFVFLALRQYFVYQADELIRHDAALYETLWAEVLRDDESRQVRAVLLILSWQCPSLTVIHD